MMPYKVLNSSKFFLYFAKVECLKRRDIIVFVVCFGETVYLCCLSLDVSFTWSIKLCFFVVVLFLRHNMRNNTFFANVCLDDFMVHTVSQSMTSVGHISHEICH